MKNSTSTIVLLGALGLGAYSLIEYKRKSFRREPINTPITTEPIKDPELKQLAQVVVNQEEERKIRLDSGIKLINESIKKKKRIPRTSRTVRKKVTVRDKRTGETRTGNIVDLNTGKGKVRKHISIRKIS
ncbi:hypothetical protein GOV10_01045 [Candidatus Woesearchaeota archaeon]|nr:hypothetical protein [Candidatus Woesearchaeota archaeon]